MCTAAAMRAENFYFGRNLDYERGFGESVVITARRYPFDFVRMGRLDEHYAMVGVAHIAENYPLYYEAVNEKGLGMAGLNFVGNAVYFEEREGGDNVSPFELIPWILGQCGSVTEARNLLNRINLVNIPFSEGLPLSHLHWMLADKRESIVVESVGDGVKIYDNPANVLTNNPDFEKQMFNLNNYMGLSPRQPQDCFGVEGLEKYSRGMGAMGLPGDLSSQSRFVRGAFVLANSKSGESEEENVSRFFHVLGAVEQQKGCCVTDDGLEYTIYSCCANADRGIFYYKTYENFGITAVDLYGENLDGEGLYSYPMMREQSILRQN